MIIIPIFNLLLVVYGTIAFGFMYWVVARADQFKVNEGDEFGDKVMFFGLCFILCVLWPLIVLLYFIPAYINREKKGPKDDS